MEQSKFLCAKGSIHIRRSNVAFRSHFISGVFRHVRGMVILRLAPNYFMGIAVNNYLKVLHSVSRIARFDMSLAMT